MTICYFGDYNQQYARNRILINGFTSNDVAVIECHDSSKSKFVKIYNLIKKHHEIRKQYDVLIVGYSSSRFLVPLAKLLSRKFIVWDAFFSLYEGWVFDRKLIKEGSLKAYAYWFFDFFSCLLADKILLDTNEHIKYFVETFKINNNKYIKVLIGADDTVFKPKK